MRVVVQLVLVSMAVLAACGGSPEPERSGRYDAVAAAGAGSSGAGGGEGLVATGGGSGASGTMSAPDSAGTGGAELPGAGSGAGSAGPGGALGEPSVGDATPEVACQRIAELRCRAETACCQDATRRSSSEAACVTQQVTACVDTLQLTKIAQDPRTGYDVAQANLAFESFASRAMQCDLGVVDWASSEEGFAGILQGSVAAGGKCTPKSPSDAAALLICQDDLACMPGTNLAAWTCVPRAGLGGRCFSDVSCEPGLRCDPDQSLPQLGKCLARKALGESCQRGAQCQSLFCEGSGDCQDEDSACVCVEATQARVYCLQAP